MLPHMLTDLLEIEVSKISKHLSFHRFGRPGIWDWGIPLLSRVSSNILSILWKGVRGKQKGEREGGREGGEREGGRHKGRMRTR